MPNIAIPEEHPDNPIGYATAAIAAAE